MNDSNSGEGAGAAPADVATMPAGREMDALVAERVLAFAPVAWGQATPCPECGGEMRYCGERSRCTTCSEWRYSPYREYSTEIAPAWDVVEAMEARGFWPAISRVDAPVAIDGGRGVWARRWDAGFAKPPASWRNAAETAPLAICRAALLAVAAQ